MNPTADWYEDRSNIVDLLRWLADNWPLTVDTTIDVVEKPHKFTLEYDEMVAGRERDQITGADRAKDRVS